MDKVTQSGLEQAKKHSLKPCPKCNSKQIALWAGDKFEDWLIECMGCNFVVHRNTLKATISRWNVATQKAKSEA